MTKRAVNFLIVEGDNYLLEWREDGHFAPGQWSVPGGKLEPGEDAVSALHRELSEELGIRPLGAGYLGAFQSGSWTIDAYVIQRYEGTLPMRTDAGDRLAFHCFGDAAPQPIWPSSLEVVVAGYLRLQEAEIRRRLSSNGLTKPNVA